MNAWTGLQSTLSFSRLSRVLLALLIFCPTLAGAEPAIPGDVTKAPDGATLEILSPADGDTITSPVTVKFGLAGMGVAPAGVESENTGHHHLIIDAPLPDFRYPVPSDANHRHFGGGQTQVSVELEPGEHTLQLLLADFRHLPHGQPVVSKKITITVK